jgi:hypothetical protein
MKLGKYTPWLLGGGAVLLIGGLVLLGGDRGEPVLSGALASPEGPATWRVFQEDDGFVAEFTLPQDQGTIEVEQIFETAEDAEAAVLAELERRGFADISR